MNKPHKWLYPHAAELDYIQTLQDFAARVTAELEQHIALHVDSDAWQYKVFLDILTGVRADAEALAAGLEADVRHMAAAIDRFNSHQHQSILRQVYGMDVFKPEPFVAGQLDVWIAENVRLIKSIPAQYLDQVAAMVAAASANGMDAATLAAQIRNSYRLPMSRAELIAVDQIGKLNGQLMRARQQNVGVTEYRWRGRLDDRERDEHVQREGMVFRWDTPPHDGHPGIPIRCRCWAEAVYPAVSDLEAIVFGDGGNRAYNEQMRRRGLETLPGGAAVVDNPYQQYGYLPRGIPQKRSGGTDAVVIDTAAVGAWGNISELRQKIKSYAKDNLAGKTVRNVHTGNEIIISMGGIKHTITGAQDELLLTVPMLIEMIKKAELIETVSDKHQDPNIVAVERYRVSIDLKGKRRAVVITAKHHLDGRRYYDHGFVKAA